MAGLRACIDRIVPPEFRQEARRVAAQENPANVPAAGLEMALETKKLWKPGRTLRVRFLGGSPTVQAGVERFARQWMNHANINLSFVKNGDAEIRIAFADDGSWSAIGTDALVTSYFKKNEPTMNYGWLTDQSTDEDYSSVVLHEFGHALGCIHEHQSPGADIKWNKEVVYRDLGGPPNNWDRATVDSNVFEKYSAEQTQFTKFDPKSIMLYSFPKSWTLDGQTLKENKVLSETDKTFMAKQYPK
jgi:hypothetical protein